MTVLRKPFKNMRHTVWINYVRGEAKEVQYDKLNGITPFLKQLMMDLIAAGRVTM